MVEPTFLFKPCFPIRTHAAVSFIGLGSHFILFMTQNLSHIFLFHIFIAIPNGAPIFVSSYISTCSCHLYFLMLIALFQFSLIVHYSIFCIILSCSFPSPHLYFNPRGRILWVYTTRSSYFCYYTKLICALGM